MSKSLDLPFRTAKQLASSIRKKKIGCLELLDLYVKRIEAYNPELNAVIASDIEGARKRAKAADKAVKAGKKLGPLHGVPMTIKESFDVAGYATTWGDPAFRNHRAEKNSLVAQRMIDAGVILFGKTNVPLNLADWQSYNEVYGSTNNPWDLSRTPGGSSGGSGAALAAGLTGIEAGSDIGASIRNPAHYCGVYGHKPTWGVVSPKGHALGGAVSTSGDIGVVGHLGGALAHESVVRRDGIRSAPHDRGEAVGVEARHRAAPLDDPRHERLGLVEERLHPGLAPPVDEWFEVPGDVRGPQVGVGAGHRCLPQVAPIVDPAQLLQAVVVSFARHVIESVPKEVHVAALPGRLGENLHETAP